MRQSEFGNINDDCFHMTQVACVAEVTYDDWVHTSFLSGSMQPHVNERDRRVVKKVLSRRAALGATTSPPPPASSYTSNRSRRKHRSSCRYRRSPAHSGNPAIVTTNESNEHSLATIRDKSVEPFVPNIASF